MLHHRYRGERGMKNADTPPTGFVSFLFTDIEASTWLLQQLGDDYRDALSAHHRILREVWNEHRGHVVSTEGDSFFVAFADLPRG
jgi:class 3 adenylate cyclase